MFAPIGQWCNFGGAGCGSHTDSLHFRCNPRHSIVNGEIGVQFSAFLKSNKIRPLKGLAEFHDRSFGDLLEAALLQYCRK